MKSMVLIVTLIALASACGDGSSDGGSVKSQTGASPTPVVTATPSGAEVPRPAMAFVGYVLNAFEVTVDSEPYADLEDFYTKELARLPAKVQAAGYDAGYKVTLDAAIGFSDLWTDMEVYVSPMAKQGYQGTSRVGRDGKFSVSLPQDAFDDLYRVRATKRIGVTLTKEKETKRVCYNFSAVEKSVPFGPNEKPVVLDAFQTNLTAYECAGSGTGDLAIPALPQKPASDGGAVARLLSPGLTKQDVLEILGREDLRIDSPTKWCWKPAIDAVRHLCVVNYADDCPCSVGFDEQGLLSKQENINATFLNIASW